MSECKLSDLEINLRVAKFQYSGATVEQYKPKPTLLGGLVNPESKHKVSSVEVRFNDLCYVINYIEDWRYAGQLVDECNISLVQDVGKCEAEITYFANVGAHQTQEECSYFYEDESAKRAIAVVYLISKGIKLIDD